MVRILEQWPNEKVENKLFLPKMQKQNDSPKHDGFFYFVFLGSRTCWKHPTEFTGFQRSYPRINLPVNPMWQTLTVSQNSLSMIAIPASNQRGLLEKLISLNTSESNHPNLEAPAYVLSSVLAPLKGTLFSKRVYPFHVSFKW